MSLNLGRSDWKALAIRWVSDKMRDDDRDALLEQMSRVERRRFGKLLEDVENKKLHEADSFVTRRQAVGIVVAFLDQKVVPIAVNLDALTARVEYLELPFYKRWWLRARKLLSKIPKEEADAEARVEDGSGARGEEDGSVGEPGQEPGDGPEDDRVHGRRGDLRGGQEEGGSEEEGTGQEEGGPEEEGLT